MIQRTWIRACEARETFDPERAFGPWILQIASRLWADDLRRVRTRARAGEVDGGADVASRVSCCAGESDVDADERERMRVAVSGLPSEQRDAILLTQYEGLSMREAAKVLGVGVPGVKRRVSRGYAALRGLLEQPAALPARRVVRLEVAGCERCDELTGLLTQVACGSCEVEIEPGDGDGPRLFVDGRRVDGLDGALGYAGTLRALGIGLCASRGTVGSSATD